jgi:peptidoglycan LD-endopeptidase CwlK
MSAKLEDLAPDVEEKARAFLSTLEQEGIPVVVTATRRKVEEQIALFAQGRASLEAVNILREKAGMRLIRESENGYVVTMLDGVTSKSRHQDGRAIDIVPASQTGRPLWPPASDPRWEQIGTIGEAHGFRWGGRWKAFPDYPHYEA